MGTEGGNENQKFLTYKSWRDLISGGKLIMRVFTVHHRKYAGDNEFDYRPESNLHTAIMLAALVIGYIMAKYRDGWRAIISLFKSRRSR